MQAFGFSQQACSRCGAMVQIPHQGGIGVCPSCHTQNTLQYAAQPGIPQQPNTAPPVVSSPYGQVGFPAGFPKAGGSGFPILRMVMGFGFAVVVGVASIGGWYDKSHYLGGGGKGKAGYGMLGIDADAADGDKMMASAGGLAKSWRSDAVWWSVNYQAVKADGTVDLSKGAEVEYVTVAGVQNPSKSGREDTIKKFQFGPNGVDYSQQWNAINQWKNVVPPPQPTCTIKQLTRQLAAKGLVGDKTVRITFDPQFQNPTNPTWRVIGQDPKMDAYFSFADCSEVKD